MKPNQVNNETESKVFYNLYGLPQSSLSAKPQKFAISDQVRIEKFHKNFRKGYEPTFTTDIFRVSNVLRGDPTMYKLQDVEGEDIIGKFYESELVKVIIK